jgi:hypothetical protein
MEKKINKASLENNKSGTTLNKIEFSLRPIEVILIALPVLFIPLLFIQGQAFRESLISTFELSQTRYAIDFHRSILEGLRSLDLTVGTLLAITLIVALVYFLAVLLCGNKFLKRFTQKLKKNGQMKLGKLSRECEENVSRIESILIFLFIIFLTSFFYIIAMNYAGKKGREAGTKQLSLLDSSYSKQAKNKYYDNENKLLVEGFELFCSKTWCAIYLEDKSISEVNLENGFIIKSDRLKI